MAISREDAIKYRKQLQDLDLKKPEYLESYKKIRRDILGVNEGCHKQVYDDGCGYLTVGIGCNLTKNKDQWKEAFGNHGPSYQDVLEGRQLLTDEQVEQLYNYMVEKRAQQLSEKLYPKVWDKLKPNERLAIEDLFYNGGHALVGEKTQFHKHIHTYAASGKPEDLDKALWEVQFNSNPKKDKGLANRRNAETDLLNTFNHTEDQIKSAAPAKQSPKVSMLDIPEEVQRLAMAAVDSNLNVRLAVNTETPRADATNFAKAPGSRNDLA